jgi:hypothetical protein
VVENLEISVFLLGNEVMQKLKVTKLGFKIFKGVNPHTSWNKTLAKPYHKGVDPSTP